VAVEWTGLGPELLLTLDRSGVDSLGSQLQRELRDAIRAGRLRQGERLPSSRALANELSVSRGLVLECYGQLEAEGYLSTRIGSATRVAARAVSPEPRSAPPARPDRLSVDFRYGVPDLTGFPVHDWLWAMGESARTAPTEVVDYGDPRGHLELRTILAAYLRRVRGSVTEPDDLVVCTGFAQGVGLVFRALARSGVRRVAIEDPGDRDLDAAAVRAGLEPVPVRVDGRGVDVEVLSSISAGAVVLTPAHQCPTGVVLGPERRTALMAWAAAADAVIIEDDYDAEFRYDRQPVGSLQGLAPDRVATVGSVSKSLAPAMRLGWVACPSRFGHLVAQEKHFADRGSPTLDQLALARLIESGRYDRHLRRMRSVYAKRRRALVEALARHAPDVALGGLAAGFHAVAHLPGRADEQSVVGAARQRSVGLYGMSGYRSDGATEPTQLVLGFGNLTEDSIRAGIAAVSDLLHR
jgi:GntR family transcriptional regulator/MocR family aminotransferase